MMDVMKKGRHSKVSIIKTAKDLPIYEIAQDYGVMNPPSRWGYNKQHETIRCPFHDDNNPSCTLWPDINAFRCWSCGVKGDVITFIQLLEKSDRVPIQTLKELINKYDKSSN